MFEGAKKFNFGLNSWNLSKVERATYQGRPSDRLTFIGRNSKNSSRNTRTTYRSLIENQSRVCVIM